MSSGTGAGQLSLSSGVIAANVTQLLGTTSAGAAGYVGIDWSAIHSATSAAEFERHHDCHRPGCGERDRRRHGLHEQRQDRL